MNYYNYFTEIEEHFVQRRGKYLLISPMDWSLIAAWRDSGVPLHVALRGIDRAMDSFDAKKHRFQKVNSLFYCNDAVMQEFSGYVDNRQGESPQEPAQQQESSNGPDRKTILQFLRSRMDEIQTSVQKLKDHQDDSGLELEPGLKRVLDRLSEIFQAIETQERVDYEALERDLNILDEALVSELRAGVGEKELDVWLKEARKELRIYRKRLPKETFEKIQRNFLRGKIHQQFQIRELSLFQL